MNVLQQLEKDQQYHTFCYMLLVINLHWISAIFIGSALNDMEHNTDINKRKNIAGIKQYQPFQTHKKLGCHISVTNDQKGQIRALGANIDNWCQKMKTRYLNDEDSWYAYHRYLRSSIQYVVGTSSFTKKEFDNLAQKLETILLHAHNMNRSCSRTMLYIPKRYGGLGINHIYHLEGQEKF